LERANPEEVNRAVLIYELLRSDLFEVGAKKPDLSGVSRFLQKEVQRVGNAALLARMIGIGKGSFHEWVNGLHLPSLPWVVRVAESCLVPIREVLTGEAPDNYAKRLGKSMCSGKKTAWAGNPGKTEMTRLKLLEALRAEPPVRLSKVSEELDIDRRTLRMVHPDLVKALTSRWGEWSREETKKRHQEKASAIRLAAEELAREGVIPTVKRVSMLLQGKVTIFSSARPECRRICEMVAEEFGLSSSWS
jgi:hypothetical protein